MPAIKNGEPAKKLNKKEMKALLQEENDYITNLLVICEVPNDVVYEGFFKDFLLLYLICNNNS